MGVALESLLSRKPHTSHWDDRCVRVGLYYIDVCVRSSTQNLNRHRSVIVDSILCYAPNRPLLQRTNHDRDSVFCFSASRLGSWSNRDATGRARRFGRRGWYSRWFFCSAQGTWGPHSRWNFNRCNRSKGVEASRDSRFFCSAVFLLASLEVGFSGSIYTTH